jgi:hypothetical protein
MMKTIPLLSLALLLSLPEISSAAIPFKASAPVNPLAISSSQSEEMQFAKRRPRPPRPPRARSRVSPSK